MAAARALTHTGSGVLGTRVIAARTLNTANA